MNYREDKVSEVCLYVHLGTEALHTPPRALPLKISTRAPDDNRVTYAYGAGSDGGGLGDVRVPANSELWG